MSSITWEDIENYIQGAMVKATGFTAEKVVWKYQNRNAPAMNYATIDLTSVITIGEDRVRYSQDLTRPNGQEIKQTITGQREVSLDLEIFSSTVTGSNSARALMEKTRTSLRLPAIKYSLRRGGIAPFDLGTVGYINDIPTVNFRGRAVCSIRCYVQMPEIVEYCGYIARVRGNLTAFSASGVTGGARIFDTNNA